MKNRAYSIAEAKSHFPELVRRAESGEAVRLTRRGRPVAVIVSPAAWEKANEQRPSLGEALKKWRKLVDAAGLDLSPEEIFGDLRDRSSGRRSPFE